MSETIYRKLKDLKKLPNNPRTIYDDDFKRLCNSVQNNADYFKARPLILSDRTGELVIIAGNQRYEAAKRLKLREVPTHLIENLTEEREREIIIRDNVANGQWDFELLDSGDWDLQDLSEWGVVMPDFEAIEDTGEPQDAEAQIDKAAELNEKWQVCKGDLFSIGSHRLLCGDSTKREDVERLMDGEKAQMVFTDPPYNVSYQANESIESLKARNRRTDGMVISNDAMSDTEFSEFLNAVLTLMPLQDGGAFYLCSPPGNTETDFRLAVRSVSGLMLKQCIVWVKDQFVFGRQDYHWRHESILYGWKEGAAHYFVDDHTQDTVWEIKRPRVNKEHPTMKPLEVPAKGIANSSKNGELIYEPFAGSGTTLVAAENLNRKCYAIEISENYCAVILERMSSAFDGIEIKRISQSEAANG